MIRDLLSIRYPRVDPLISIDPINTPFTKYRCSHGYTSRIGSMTNTVYAMSSDRCVNRDASSGRSGGVLRRGAWTVAAWEGAALVSACGGRLAALRAIKRVLMGGCYRCGFA